MAHAVTPQIDPKFARYGLRVGRSPVHRYGVFALEEIPRGRLVIEYTGKRLTYDQAQKIRPPRDAYVATVSDRWLVDARIGGSGAEFINHSCNPNLSWRRIRGHLFYFSRKKIRVGEELTGGYGYPIKIRRVPCHCGARGCKGTLRYILR